MATDTVKDRKRALWRYLREQLEAVDAPQEALDWVTVRNMEEVYPMLVAMDARSKFSTVHWWLATDTAGTVALRNLEEAERAAHKDNPADVLTLAFLWELAPPQPHGNDLWMKVQRQLRERYGPWSGFPPQ